MANTKLHLW